MGPYALSGGRGRGSAGGGAGGGPLHAIWVLQGRHLRAETSDLKVIGTPFCNKTRRDDGMRSALNVLSATASLRGGPGGEY